MSIIKGEPAYLFRVGERNITAPPWMVSDLVLGRRQVPQLRLANCSVSRVQGLAGLWPKSKETPPCRSTSPISRWNC